MSNGQPTVTVITRTYGSRREFLEAAARSITGQTYRPIEWLIVEDGVSSAPEVLDKLALPTGIAARCLRNDKLGRSAAANRGLDEASGDYIVFFDDDDELFPTHLTELAGLLKRYPDAAGAYAASIEVARSKDRGGAWQVHGERVHFFPMANSGALLKINPFPIQAVMFRRQAVYHQRFDTNLDALEDWLFWQEIFLERKLVFTPAITSRYFVPASSAENKKRLQAHRDAENAFGIQANAFYTERGIWQWGAIVEHADSELRKAAEEASLTTPYL